jgi:hypothetical protein
VLFRSWQSIKLVAFAGGDVFNFGNIVSKSFSKDNYVRVIFSELCTDVNIDFSEKFGAYSTAAMTRKIDHTPTLLAGYA